jgi:hypothetical protein
MQSYSTGLPAFFRSYARIPGVRRMISEIESRLNSSYTHQMGDRIRWSHLMVDSTLKGDSVRPLEQMLKNSFRRNT